LETRIRFLCALLLAAEDSDSVQAIAAELQAALHDHIERIRDKPIVLPSITSTSREPAA
jgi:hypothetical protein